MNEYFKKPRDSRTGGLARKAQVDEARRIAALKNVPLKEVLGNVGGRPPSKERMRAGRSILAAIEHVVNDDHRRELIELFKRVAPTALYIAEWQETWGDKMAAAAHHRAFRGYGTKYRAHAMKRVAEILREHKKGREEAAGLR